MDNNIQKSAMSMNEMVANGQLIEAAEKFYAPDIRTVEFDGTITEGRQAAMKKLTDFVSAIKKVKEITLLRSASENNASFAEYILDIDMKDGSNISMHEIVRSLWENDRVVEERYFKG